MDAHDSSRLMLATFPGLSNSVLKKRVREALPGAMHNILAIYGGWVAGGFIRDAAVSLPYKDIDYYCRPELQDDVERRLHYSNATLTHTSIHGNTFTLPVGALPNTDGTALIFADITVQVLPTSLDINAHLASFDLDNCRAAFTTSSLITTYEFNEAVQSGNISSPGSVVGFGPGTYHRIQHMLRDGWCSSSAIINAAWHIRGNKPRPSGAY